MSDWQRQHAFVAVVLMALVFGACEFTQPNQGTRIGGNVTRWYAKDANSGRCLRIEQVGRLTRAWVAGDEMCEGRNLQPKP